MIKSIEIWCSVKGYEGLYEVSTWGRIRSIGTQKHSGRIMKLKQTRFGYIEVSLFKDKKYKTFKVHRLVAIAFIPNPLNLPFINHRDEDKANNRVENLEWCTSKYNANFGTRNQRVVKKISKPVAQYTLDGILVAVYPSAREAAKQTGLLQGHITECCQGKLKKHGGFIWRYA